MWSKTRALRVCACVAWLAVLVCGFSGCGGGTAGQSGAASHEVGRGAVGESLAPHEVGRGATGESHVGAGSRDAAAHRAPYGVFVGLDAEDAALLADYDLVVVDAAYFTRETVAALQQNGVRVYSYLNVGSIERFRAGAAALQHCALDPYEGWPDEVWADVSQPAWQGYIAAAAAALAEKGVDGFFIDNADVYDQYPTDAMLQGLVAIFEGLAQCGVDVVVNGGDAFVAAAVLEAETPLVHITGVNQECVFTGIDFATGTFTVQEPDATRYYQDYLEACAEAGLAIYLTEYTAEDTARVDELETYCAAHGFTYFVASSLNLDGVNTA